MSRGVTQNDLAWEKILEQSPEIRRAIEERAYFDIAAETIKDHREPRLACKIDFREQTPQPLRELHSSVLALSNSRYRIARTDPFIAVAPRLEVEPQRCPLPKHIRVLSPDHITSESKALDAAFVSGILNDLTQDKLSLVLRGREYCSSFEFSLPDQQNPSRHVDYPVNGVQVEVDGGYEGKDGIYLIEAKVGGRNNMNLRQLLYPHLHYQNKYRKPIKSYVMFYRPDSRQFHFAPFNLSSLQLDDAKNHRCYELESWSSESPRWEQIATVQVDREKTDLRAPFPQANNFELVVEIFLKLHNQKQLDKEEWFADHDITPRQYDYYANVLRWMRLIRKKSDPKHGVVYELSERGNALAEKPVIEMLLEMARIVFSNSLFNLYLHQDQPNIPARIREENRLRSDNTFQRRLHTVQSWRNYFRKIFSN